MPSSTIEEDVIVFEYCDDSYIIRRYDAKWKEYYNECIIKKGYDLAGRVIHDINEKNCFTIDDKPKQLSLLEYAFFIKNDLEVARLLKSPKRQLHDDIADEQWRWYWAVSVRRRGGLPLKAVNDTKVVTESISKPALRP